LLGKELNAPVIEMHFPASQFLFEQTTIACLTGADFSASVDNKAVPIFQPFLVPAGSLLQFKKLVAGAHCYLSMLHEMELEEWLGSTSTNLKAVAGGYKGRPFEKNDSISFEEKIDLSPLDHLGLTNMHWKVFPPHINNCLDCIKGPEWEWLTGEAQWNFQNKSFTISNLSDRMGYRLFGENLEVEKCKEMISSAVDFGTIQLLPNGQLIILMADHQTTGGYPRVANLSSSTLSSIAQLRPGHEISFRFIRIIDAEDKLVQQRKYLEQLQNACKLKIENFLHASLRS
jgi:antagonist of KipI